MNLYKITLKHDNGRIVLTTAARTEEAAKRIILKAENAPESAIIKIKKL